MKLYTHPISQHARRVRMLCHELNLAPEEEIVDLQSGKHRSESFLKINPAGQVPVLVDGDVTFPESHVIMKYLASAYGDNQFYQHDQQREIDRWLDWTHCTLNPSVQTIAIERFVRGEQANQSLIEECHGRVTSALEGFEAGYSLDEITLADFAVASTLALYQMVGGSFEGSPKVSARFRSVSKRPSFKTTAPQM